MVTYMYRGDIEDKIGYNAELFLIASQYHLFELMARCEMSAIQTISDVNVVALWKVCHLFYVKRLWDEVVAYMVTNWRRHQQFLGLESVWKEKPRLVRDLLRHMPLKDIGAKNMKMILLNSPDSLGDDILNTKTYLEKGEQQQSTWAVAPMKFAYPKRSENLTG